MTLPRITLPVALVLLLQLSPARGAEEPDGPSFHADAEIDPTAYALSGHSLHVGLGYGRFRLDLGNFAIDVPGFAEPTDGFDSSFSGYGVKLQVFPFAEQRGLFVGVDSTVSQLLLKRENTQLAHTETRVAAGIHLGGRIPLPASFHVTPWIGIAYNFGIDDVSLDGATYEPSTFTVFPAVHLGYAFR